jgi:penicillin-binding protein 2
VVHRRAFAVNPKSLPVHRRHRALFIGYAPAENPDIAVAVMVEGGGYGGSTAAPIARKIFDAWLLKKMPDGGPPGETVPGIGDVGNTRISVGIVPEASVSPPGDAVPSAPVVARP